MNISDLERRINYHFSQPALLQTALTHRSYSVDHNERLEFLGDSIVNMVMAGYLFLEFPEAREGQLSRLRASLVKGETLAEIARHLQMGDFLLLGSGERKSGGATRESILADVVEAVIGAIYLDADKDMKTVQDCIFHWFGPRLKNLSLSQKIKDAKSQLQEYLQANKHALPEYRIVSIDGAEHDQLFTVACGIEAMKLETTGQGRNRKAAEQLAAQAALEQLDI